jgi:CheY-like chemotaxis protein
MNRLVGDLLQVGRVTGGKVHLERAPLDLARVAGEVLHTWKASGRFSHHRVEAQLEPTWILADRARLEQVLSNLLDNAEKYTPHGGEVRVSVRTIGGNARLEVSDTGEGMAPALIGRVFDLFVQGERSLAREAGGLGIGLTMVKRLVELHGGTIRAASDGPGKGSRFIAELPAIERPAGLAAVKPHPAGRPPRRRIVLIEDNPDARDSLAALLRLGGHEVHATESGLHGLEKALAWVPDLALIDIGLRDLDGYEIARRLRRNEKTRQLRLVAVTGYGTPEDRRRALAAGFDEHLPKPVDPKALERLLGSLAAAA